MIEAAAEANEELMNKYLEEGTLTEEEIIKGIRQRTIACEIQPMLCGTAFKNKSCFYFFHDLPLFPTLHIKRAFLYFCETRLSYHGS